MRLLKQLVVVGGVAFLGGQGVTAVRGNAWLTLVIGFATVVLATLAYRWVVRRTERRAPDELALRTSSQARGDRFPGQGAGAGAAFGRGALIGLAMCVAVIVNIALLGDYHVHGFGSLTGTLGLVGFMAAAAVTEELLFRGILFRIVEERLGTWLALTVTGVLFGVSHLFNPHASLWGAIAIAVEAGFMLAAAYVATRTLWLPIGLHFGWNFALGGLFGAEVSGNGAAQGLLDATTSGPTLLSGGGFGPEGSVYTVVAGVVLTVVFLWLARRRGHLVPRRRRADRAGTTATLAR
jgi:membrane protease YdiL (CAAX protease family)